MKIKGLLAIFLVAMVLEAKGVNNITITTSSFQQVIKKDKSGKIKKIWVKTTKVVPGTIIKYVNVVKNNSDKIIENVKVQNQIDPHLEYIKNSATSNKDIVVKFKTKNSKEFLEPNKLYINQNGKKRLALPKEYRAIEWNIKSIKPHTSIKLEYKAKLK